MPEATADPCAPWAEAADVPCLPYDADLQAVDDGIVLASGVLWNLTGRRWSGVCTDLVRPTYCGCTGGWLGPWWTPPGVARPFGMALCGCGCSGVSEVRLPGYPVVGVTEVLIDGQVVDPSNYRVDQRRRLVWQGEGGRGGWPCCQHLDRPADAEGTWSVEYEFGQAPPAGGVRAAAVLGYQLALLCNPTTAGQCRFPTRITSVTRQGVTMTVNNLAELFAAGNTGLPDVDLWLASVQAGDKGRRATAWVPGKRGGARRTT